MITYISSN